ncbi:hypothetical protein J5X84_17655 [Streptosporangiaceae bacterium NEAU-GS5]|nr:hypothetical protein [Streptosporangiaceae bacterium NEAU-GS5]
METWVLGVRHHGPGSARAVRDELARIRPDVVLIEGPPEADPLVALADPAEGMEPPVALLAHVPGDPSKAAFWPFAVFSPEWQAIRHALAAAVPVRFCDLPAANSLAAEERHRPGLDPIGALAEAAGYDDPERWWEDAVEHRGDTPFQVIAEAMTAVREGHEPEGYEARREAYMRRTIRAAIKDGFERIAVICGAWHVPALTSIGPAAPDDRLLRGLPKVKVEMTWVPWTHGRLAFRSGYGAGVTSPGWYHHLFAVTDRPIERWLAEAAAVLRSEGLTVSSAHVIEAVRLARSLAVIRGRPLPGLSEVTEATRAVLCEGDELPVELIQRRMVVGERLGRVPDATPMVPLQRHLRDEQRRLRLKPEALDREYDLDLRRPLDLARSRLLHRLLLLGVPWGTPRESRGKGTFRESWTLEWRPEFDVALIEAGAWGTTAEVAATALIQASLAGPASAAQPDLAGQALVKAESLSDLTSLVERCLLADLPEALRHVLVVIGDRAALDTDVAHLMAALPSLVRALRYGDVRGTPAEGLGEVVHSLLARVRVGLPSALAGLDDDSARAMASHIDGVHSAVALLTDEQGDLDERAAWTATLAGLADREDLPGVIEGRIVRILFDARAIADVDVRMSRAMSPGHPPMRAAAWIEGFLADGGLLLVHDARLLALVDTWLTGLTGEAFVDVLPLLRRTFGAFAPPERRSIGERLRSGSERRASRRDPDDERAAQAVRTVELIFGRGGAR